MSTQPEFPPDRAVRQVRDPGSPLEIYKTVMIDKYADFTGRARRAEYWWFAVMHFAVSFVVFILGAIIADDFSSFAIFVWLYWLAVLVPSIAVAVRRLHDTNKSGWFLLIGFIPLVGAILLLVFYFTDGDPHDNQYGPSPKYVTQEA